MLVLWREKKWCQSFIIITEDGNNTYNSYDYCKEGAWATVSFILAIMYFVTSACVFYFLNSGRHAEWERKLQQQQEESVSATTNIEIGTVEQQQQSTIALATAAPVPTALTNEDYVIQHDDSGKID